MILAVTRRLYRYAGPDSILARSVGQPPGMLVRSPADVRLWAAATGQSVRPGEALAATFVVEPAGDLRIADRHSEHVTCAAGGPVLSAGEVFFDFSDEPAGGVRVDDITNQSTGYCPEPASWPAVRDALDRAGIPHPGGFTRQMVFRRCTACGSRNIVKDDWYVCDVCAAALSREWNFDPR